MGWGRGASRKLPGCSPAEPASEPGVVAELDAASQCRLPVAAVAPWAHAGMLRSLQREFIMSGDGSGCTCSHKSKPRVRAWEPGVVAELNAASRCRLPVAAVGPCTYKEHAQETRGSLQI